MIGCLFSGILSHIIIKNVFWLTIADFSYAEVCCVCQFKQELFAAYYSISCQGLKVMPD